MLATLHLGCKFLEWQQDDFIREFFINYIRMMLVNNLLILPVHKKLHSVNLSLDKSLFILFCRDVRMD